MPDLDALVRLICLIWLARIAWIDLRHLRIGNWDVLLLSAFALVLLILPRGMAAVPDVAGAAFLFALGFLFWLFRLMGAGDAKLFFPVGLIVGWNGLLLFAMALLPSSLVTLGVLVLLPRLLARAPRLRAGVRHLSSGKGIPYAVPIFLSALLAQSLT